MAQNLICAENMRRKRKRRKMYYLDYASTGFKKPDSVVQAVAAAVCGGGNPGRGFHAPSLLASRAVYEARETVCRFFDGENSLWVAFTKNATEALNLILFGLILPGDHVITTKLEHNSVLRPLYELERRGAKISFLPCKEDGVLCVEKLPELLQKNTKLVVVTHASNVTGNVTKLKEISVFCKEHGLLFVVDAAQTAGMIPISMKEMNIDALCFSGHKSLLGPQGIGGVCLKPGIIATPLLFGGSGSQTFEKGQPASMPVRLEAGTLNVPGILGLKAGIDYILEQGIELLFKKAEEHMHRFYEGVLDIPKIQLFGAFDKGIRCSIISLRVDGISCGEVADRLANDFFVITRSGFHCAPRMHEVLGTEKTGTIRFSFSSFTTKEEVDAALLALNKIVRSKV